MKKVTCIIVAVLFVSMLAPRAGAQNFKFAHINSEELVRAMPEWDSANAKLEKLRQDLVNNLELMSVELNNKNDAYNKESKTLTDIVKQSKEQEIIDLQRRIQEFQNNAQQQLQDENMKLFQPIYTKADKAIKEVGKENGFIYVLDVAKGSLLYFDETKSTNILSLVKAKLNLK
jgi:outer membrane protein